MIVLSFGYRLQRRERADARAWRSDGDGRL